MTTTVRYRLAPATETITPLVDPGWTDPTPDTGTLRVKLTTASAASLVDLYATNTATEGTSSLNLQAHGPAVLPEGRITGTFRAMVNLTRGVTSAGAPRVVVRVVSGDGTVVRGTLFEQTHTSPVLSSSDSSRGFSGALLPVFAQNGDRIVVEIGTEGGPVSGTGTTTARSKTAATEITDDYPYAVAPSAGSQEPGAAWFEFEFDENHYARYYLSQAPANHTTPVVPGAWDVVQSPYTSRLLSTLRNETLASAIDVGSIPAATSASVTGYEYVATTLPAGTYEGSYSLALARVSVSVSFLAGIKARWRLLVVDHTHSVVRKVLDDFTHPTAVDNTNRTLSVRERPTGRFTVKPGDRLVLQVGNTGTNTSASQTKGANIRIGSQPGVTDADPDGTSLSTDISWFDTAFIRVPAPPPAAPTITNTRRDATRLDFAVVPDPDADALVTEWRLDGSAWSGVSGGEVAVHALNPGQNYLFQARSRNEDGTSLISSMEVMTKSGGRVYSAGSKQPVLVLRDGAWVPLAVRAQD